MTTRRQRQTQYATYRSGIWWRWVSFITHLVLYPFLRGRCIMCPRPATFTHHRHYGNRGREWPVRDIVPVCAQCHKKFHSNTP